MTEVLTKRRVRSPFLPYQRAWINDESPRKIVDKARRTGFTFVEAYDATARRFRKTQPRDQDYWMSSADESSAYEFIEYCRFFAKDMFGQIADQFTEQVGDERTGRLATAFVIRCPNGKRITAMTANPRRFRSKGGDVTLDEFAFHDGARAMYTAAEPVTRWGGSMRILSTPNGEDTEYHKLVQRCYKVLAACGHDHRQPPRDVPYETLLAQAREMRKTPYFSYHRITIEEAIAQGLVEKINETRGTTWTRETFLQDCRDACLDEDAYQQEYMCVAGQGKTVWLPYALIETVEHDACPQPGQPLTGYQGGICFVGVDVARKHDLTVIWVMELVGDVLWTRQVVELQNMPLPEQQATLAEVLHAVRLGRCCIDETGLGLGLSEYTQRQFGEQRVEGVTFTNPNKHAMAIGIKQRFEDKAARIPADNSAVREDLHSVRKSVTAGGFVSYEAPRSKHGHADRFWATCLAIRAAGEGMVAWDGTLHTVKQSVWAPRQANRIDRRGLVRV